LCVYVSSDCAEILQTYAQEYSNIKIMKHVEVVDLWTYKASQDIEYTLPANRNDHKDNDKYMWIMNSKIEFMYDAIQNNPWNSTHFAWIDFNVSHVFRSMESSQEYLRVLSRRHFIESFLAIPGCYPKLEYERIESIMDNINWRFCGGFFMGDMDSVKHMYELYQKHFVSFLQEHKKLIWEVNFWAWLETAHGWRPVWYCADHDDRIIQIPPDCYTRRLLSMRGTSGCIYFDYPKSEHFEPTSAAYIEANGKHWLNTRYVSYWLTPQCGYVYPDGTNIIRNINMLSELDPETWMPISYQIMDESSVGLPEYQSGCNFQSKGLEDMRLYLEKKEDGNDKIKFIATSVNYSPSGRNRMVIGDYNTETANYSNCVVIESPNPDSWCEKNWIPLTDSFIYKWSPMVLGNVNKETNALELNKSYFPKAPIFSKMRGSSTFKQTSKGWIGVVHFSEDGCPRHYYHVLVLLEEHTWRPLSYSQSFYFDKVGIEFCIGFNIVDDDYMFWISRFDRDPMCITAPQKCLPLCFDALC
jgi:hypothetical protein